MMAVIDSLMCPRQHPCIYHTEPDAVVKTRRRGVPPHGSEIQLHFFSPSSVFINYYCHKYLLQESV